MNLVILFVIHKILFIGIWYILSYYNTIYYTQWYFKIIIFILIDVPTFIYYKYFQTIHHSAICGMLSIIYSIGMNL